MSVVISDTSPVRALNHLGLLPLLSQLYGTVIVPPEVARELAQPRRNFVPIDVTDFPFFETQAPRDQEFLATIGNQIDRGEAEAIALAIELTADAILIDEIEGRRVAREAGLTIVGVVGILIQLKHRGLIAQIEPLFDDLRINLRFFISEQVVMDALRVAGER